MDTIPANTSTNAVITPGSLQLSAIDTIGDRDWFRTTLEAGFTYGITMEGTGSANELARPEYFVRSANGTELANFADGDFNGFVGGSFRATTTGTYYIDATGYNDGFAGDYRLTLGTDDFANTTATTGTVSAGSSVSGSIDVNTDRDWFAITLQAGFSYNIAMEGTGTLDELTRPEFFVRNANGTSLANFADGDFNGFAEGRFDVATTGTYYIDATGYNDGLNGDYIITVGTDDYTNNVATTGTIAPGGSATGTIGSLGDRDWFEISFQSGFSYNITMDGTGANGDLSRVEYFVRNANGTEVQNRADADFDGVAGGIYNATANGTYYIDATGYNDGYRGDYTLFVGTDEARNNTATQQTITVDGSVSGSIDGLGDRDWYSVTLEEGLNYAIRMEGTGTTSEVTRVEYFVYDANGTEVSNRADSDFDGVTAGIFTPSTAGTYFIAATGYNDGYAGDYILSLAGDDARNSIQTTRSIAAGEAVTGEIGLNGDRDWFRTSLQAGQAYTFSLEGDGSAEELSTVELNLYDATGNFIANYDTGTIATQTAVFTPSTAGTYYVEALGRNDGDSGTYILSLAGARPLTTGTNQDDILIGDSAGENFSGLAGDDVIIADAGNDILRGGDGDDVLIGGDGIDFLYGEDGSDNLVGGNGSDYLYGSVGADFMDGGNGIDRVQYTDSNNGLRIDLASSFNNTGIAKGDTFKDIENVRASFGNDIVIGTDDNNRLEGLSGNDFIDGRGGNDVLVGGSGNEIFFGGAGGDLFFGDTGTDRVHYGDSSVGVRADLQVEAANTGIAAGDRYFDIENLRGTNFNDDLRGDTGDNQLEGLSGNDILNGRDGDDVLVAGAGNDILFGGAGGDVFNGGTGTDRAQYTDSSTGLRVDLQNAANNNGIAAGDSYVSIENLRGSTGGDDLRGDAGANLLEGLNGNDFLTGRGGNDFLQGGNGNDVIYGGTGNDLMLGGGGADSFRFNAFNEGVDTIIDFAANTDTIRLNDAGFTALTPGALSAANFRSGSAAQDANDYIIFDGSNLYYDADGNGAGAQVRFAILNGNPALDADDFVIV